MTSNKIKKIALWLLASITIVNFAILATIAYYLISNNYYHQPVKKYFSTQNLKECPVNCDSITLRKYSKFKTHYRNRTFPLVDSLRELRFAMMDELQKDNPDTIKLNKLAEKSGIVYTQLRKKTVNQLMVIKDSFPPEFRRNFMHKCGRNYNREHAYKKNRHHKRAEIKELRNYRNSSCRKN